LVAITVSDPREMGLPKIGLIELEDAETGECVVVDTSSEAVRREYERLARQRREKLLGLFRSRGIDHIEMLAGRDHVRELTVFFRARERRH
jgi:hypothetical protein